MLAARISLSALKRQARNRSLCKISTCARLTTRSMVQGQSMLEVLWEIKARKVIHGISILWIRIKSHYIDVLRSSRRMSSGLPQRPTAFGPRRKRLPTWGTRCVQPPSAPRRTWNATSSTQINPCSKTQPTPLPTCIGSTTTSTRVRTPSRLSLSASSSPAIRPVTSRMYYRSWTRGSNRRSERSRGGCSLRPWDRWHMRKKSSGNRPICFQTSWKPWKRRCKISL